MYNVQIFYTEVYPKELKKRGGGRRERERNMDKISFKPVQYDFHQSIFMKLTPAQWHYVEFF
jgi:hypothetical protein